MKLENLKKYCEGMSNTYPDLEDEIRDLYFLAETEVEDGEPEYMECEKCVSDVKELIADWNKEVKDMRKGKVELIGEDEFNQLIVDDLANGVEIEFEDE
mgnify:CR=1 FL=1